MTKRELEELRAGTLVYNGHTEGIIKVVLQTGRKERMRWLKENITG